MANLEQVVRPVQQQSIRPGVATQLLQTPQAPANETIVWGSSGDSVFDLQAHSSGHVNPATWPESDRTFDVVRVFNPDDKAQFVDTEQMTEYQSRNKLSNERFSLKFATNSNTENTKVISTGNKRHTNQP